MQALGLLRFELTVADLDAAAQFYAALPGIVVGARNRAEPAMAALLSADTIEQLWLQRGEQTIVLQQFSPSGAPYPAEQRACDQAFQHFALPVPDATIPPPPGAVPISPAGAQLLPASSGGATAYKFRDPEGHPLEFIQFADRHGGGIDHSAVVSADVERSIDFYRETLGLVVGSRQTNQGPEQDRLDGLTDTVVDVVALLPKAATPHIELLAYRVPTVIPAGSRAPNDVAATRLVLAVDRLTEAGVTMADGSKAMLIRDPDGHLLVLMQPPG